MKMNSAFRIRFLLVLTSLLLVNVAALSSTRGRVVISNGQLRTDTGKPLRGTDFFIDIYNTYNWIQQDYDGWRNYFRDVSTVYNLNMVRICCWSNNYTFADPDTFKWVVDEVVKWCEEDGIYAMLNYHTEWHKPMNVQAINDFWDYYAPKYKDNTNVFYELINEPLQSDASANMESIYANARALAPNTHLACWSASRGNPTELPLSMLQAATGIDYSNASVGYHDYSSDYEGYSERDHALMIKNNGFPILCTEFHCDVFGASPLQIDWHNLTRIVKGNEAYGISWAQWLPPAQYETSNSQILFTSQYWTEIDNAGITRWAADNNSGGSGNLLSNGDFENTLTSWYNAGCSYGHEVVNVHSGAGAVSIWSRTGDWAGPRQDVRAALEANGPGDYTIGAWFNMVSGSATMKAAVEYKYGGQYYYAVLDGAANSTNWSEISGTVNLNWSGTLEEAVFYLSSQVGTDPFYADDCMLAKNEPPLPAAPTSLNAATVSDSQIDLNWTDNSNNEDGFRIERSDDGGTTFSQVATVGADIVTYQNTGLAALTTYDYRVSAFNNSGDSDWSNISSATTNSSGSTADAAIAFASSAPAIDGSIDNVWSSASSYFMNNVIVGSVSSNSDLSGIWRALWDNSNLYFLVEITDEAKINDSAAAYLDDAVEIFIDADNSKASSYDGVNDFQYSFRWNDGVVHIGANSVNNTTGIVFQISAVSSGYVFEASIPWSTLGVTPSQSSLIGVEVQVNDDDDGGDRDGKKAWYATNDNCWQDPSLFAEAELTVGIGGGGSDMLSNGGFENALTDWYNVGCSWGHEQSNVHSGSGAVSIWGRSADWAGPRQDILDVLQANGQGDYTIGAWFKMTSGTASMQAAIEYKYGGQYHYAIITGSANSSSWSEVSGTENLSWTGSLEEATFYLSSESGSAAFYADDCFLTGGSGTPAGNLALNKPVTVSSTETGLDGANAVDGDSGTRWASDLYVDPQWIYVDMGTVYTINNVILNWEAAYASTYQIQVSNDAISWTDVYSTTTGNGAVDDINFGLVSARYVRMYGTARGTEWGYSLWEFEVYNTLAKVATKKTDESKAISKSFVLNQNYPNPFNPQTQISYQLASEAHVSLKIYNMNGQVVTTLVDEVQQSGQHNVMWGGRNHAGLISTSGIYLYRLDVHHQKGDFTDIKKMIFIK